MWQCYHHASQKSLLETDMQVGPGTCTVNKYTILQKSPRKTMHLLVCVCMCICWTNIVASKRPLFLAPMSSCTNKMSAVSLWKCKPMYKCTCKSTMLLGWYIYYIHIHAHKYIYTPHKSVKPSRRCMHDWSYLLNWPFVLGSDIIFLVWF